MPAARRPAVPAGGARLRLTVTAEHDADDCCRLLADPAEELHD